MLRCVLRDDMDRWNTQFERDRRSAQFERGRWSHRAARFGVSPACEAGEEEWSNPKKPIDLGYKRKIR